MTRRARRILALAGVVAAVGAGLVVMRLLQPIVLDAPLPAIGPDAPDSANPVRVSVVEAPISYDLRGALDSLEAAVPREYGDMTTRIQAGDNRRAHFAFVVRRSPFRLSVSGTTVSLSTTVEYEARGWYKPVIGPEVSAACGTGGVPRPRIAATLVSTARITPDWQLHTRTRIGRLRPVTREARDRCRVTIFQIDITNRVVDATRNLLRQKLAIIDAGVAHWDSRQRFEALWRTLQRPIRLSDSIYMMINPFSAHLGTIAARGDTVFAPLRLLASPLVESGGRPSDFDFIHPLPKLEMGGPVGQGVDVVMEGTLEYPVAAALLRKAIKGTRIEQPGHVMVVRDVQVMGIGGGRIALGVTLSGAVRGRMFFTGTPSLDRDKRELYVPDLEIDVGTADLLVRGLDWLQGDAIRDFLRDKARVSEAEIIGRLRELAEQNVNRTLSEGIELQGLVHSAQATSVFATIAQIRVRAHAKADLRLSISRAPSLPRPPEVAPQGKGK